MTEREIAEKMIADAERIAKAGKDKLAELDKPKLRHGDYGILNDGARWIVLLRNSQLEVFGGKSGSGKTVSEFWPNPKTKLGNLVDDLKRNSEDLRETRIESHDGCYFDGRINEHGIRLTLWPHSTYYTISEATEIYQKLGQLIATAKRKK